MRDVSFQEEMEHLGGPPCDMRKVLFRYSRPVNGYRLQGHENGRFAAAREGWSRHSQKRSHRDKR